MSNGALSKDEIKKMLGATDEQFSKMIQNAGEGSIPKDDINLLMNAVNTAQAVKDENEEINKKFYEENLRQAWSGVTDLKPKLEKTEKIPNRLISFRARKA